MKKVLKSALMATAGIGAVGGTAAGIVSCSIGYTNDELVAEFIKNLQAKNGANNDITIYSDTTQSKFKNDVGYLFKLDAILVNKESLMKFTLLDVEDIATVKTYGDGVHAIKISVKFTLPDNSEQTKNDILYKVILSIS